MNLDEACLGKREEGGMPYTGQPLIFRDHGIFPDASTVLKVGDVLEMVLVLGGPLVRARVIDVKPGYVEYEPC